MGCNSWLWRRRTEPWLFHWGPYGAIPAGTSCLHKGPSSLPPRGYHGWQHYKKLPKRKSPRKQETLSAEKTGLWRRWSLPLGRGPTEPSRLVPSPHLHTTPSPTTTPTSPLHLPWQSSWSSVTEYAAKRGMQRSSSEWIWPLKTNTACLNRTLFYLISFYGESLRGDKRKLERVWKVN